MSDEPRPSTTAAVVTPVVHALMPLGDASQPSSPQIAATSAVAAPKSHTHPSTQHATWVVGLVLCREG